MMTLLRKLDDCLIDRLAQPFVDLAGRYCGLTLHTLAKALLIAGAVLEVGFIRLAYLAGKPSFAVICGFAGATATAVLWRVAVSERNADRRAAAMPAERLSQLHERLSALGAVVGLTLLACFDAAALREAYTVAAAGDLLLFAPYWLICCRQPPRRGIASLAGWSTQP